MKKGERLSFSSISVADELLTSRVLKNFNCHYSVQGTPDCVFWNCQVERKGIRHMRKRIWNIRILRASWRRTTDFKQQQVSISGRILLDVDVHDGR